MKMKKLLGGFSIAALLAVGAGAGLLSQPQQVLKAEADDDPVSFVAGTNIYLAGKGDIDVTGSVLSAWVFYTSGSHWESFEFDNLSGYYMITLDESATGLTFARTQNKSDGGTEWSDVGTVHNQTDMNFEEGKNWIWPKSWDNSVTCEWRFISYHVAGTFTDPGWQGTSASYKMSDNINDSSEHEAYFVLTTSEEDVEMKCTANYNGTVPEANWYGTLADGYNTEFIGYKDGNILLKKAATYEIFLKADRTVWVQISSAEEAEHYAEAFLEAIKCANNATDFALNVWNKVGEETSSMEYKFEQLTKGAKNIFKNAEPNKDGTKVEKAVARYEHIVNRYGYGTEEGQYHEFMGRHLAPSQGAKVPSSLFSSDNNQTVIVISIVAGVSVLSLLGLVILKKKRAR